MERMLVVYFVGYCGHKQRWHRRRWIRGYGQWSQGEQQSISVPQEGEKYRVWGSSSNPNIMWWGLLLAELAGSQDSVHQEVLVLPLWADDGAGVFGVQAPGRLPALVSGPWMFFMLTVGCVLACAWVNPPQGGYPMYPSKWMRKKNTTKHSTWCPILDDGEPKAPHGTHLLLV